MTTEDQQWVRRLPQNLRYGQVLRLMRLFGLSRRVFDRWRSGGALQPIPGAPGVRAYYRRADVEQLVLLQFPQAAAA